MKNDSSIYYDVLKTLRTKQEVDQFLIQIDTLLARLFKTTSGSFEENLKKITSLNFALLLKEALSKNNINPDNRQDLEGFLNDLKNEARKLKVIKLEIAFDPPDETISNIFDWISRNMGKGIILDITSNPSLIGGAIITFEGKYKDLSLKKRFEDIFQKKYSPRI